LFIVRPSPVPVLPFTAAFQVSPAQALAITKAVVAICVVFVAAAAVGAVGVPVRAGEARGALASSAVCSPEVLAIERAVSAIAVALPTLVTTPVKLAFVVTVAAFPEMFVWSPVFVPERLATAPFASIAFVIAPLAIAVALPTEVTAPVRFALVVTVVASATPILAVPSKEVPPIVLAVVSFGAETIVITGVVVVVATVASAFAEVTEDTVPANTISQAPSNDTLLIVFIFVPETRVACFASRADCVAVDIGRLLTAQSPIALDAEV